MVVSTQLKTIAFSGFVFMAQIVAAQKDNIDIWLTNNDRSALFEQQPSLSFSDSKSNGQTIAVDDAKTFQRMDGFGFALTGGSAMHIVRMTAPARNKLLHQLFDTTGTAIGVSY